MAIRVYRVAVVGCPRAVITEDTLFDGVGKSCLCNRFVRPEAYSEAHRSLLSEADWSELPVYNRDHFVYWGAATKHLQDGSKVRFQVVEQTEFYDSGTTEKLCAHQAKEKYISRASALRFSSQSGGKVACKLQAELGGRNGRLVRATQLFPSEDFSSKSGNGVYGFVCVFDPSLEGEEMKRQLDYLAELLQELGKKKRKVVLACTKCDAVDETKIRHGSNLANYALKKPIPFLEVSAREGVNVEEAFFSTISPPKKRRASKNSKRYSTGYLSYKEIVSLRKHDLNRARDAYRRLLQRKVTDFSCVWSEVFPTLEREQEFSLVLQLGGKEGKDIVKKMFCLRLIEIKLMEASKRFGFSSAKKKLDKDQSRSHQVYLSEAFKGHPDLGTESLYDYVYSPGASVPGDIFGTLPTESGSDYTEPSTPNTYSSSRTTPDCIGISPTPHSTPSSARYSLLPPPRPRSATCTLSHTVIHIPDDGGSSYDSATLPISASKNASADQLLVSTKHFSYHDEAVAPPLPYRAEASPLSSPLRKDDATTKSQSFVDFSSPGMKEEEVRRISNSMDPLLVPKDDKSGAEKNVGDLNAAPYLQPIEVQQVLGALPPIPVLPPTPVEKRESNSLFRSMRLPKPSQRPSLPRPDSTIVDHSPASRTNSMKARGHQRSHSNPWILESRTGVIPPPVPTVSPRLSDIPPPVPPRDTPKHRLSKTPPPSMYTEVHQGDVLSPIESSLDYHDGTLQRNFPQAPFTPQKRVSMGREADDDNASDVSGPFEEIDEPGRNMEDEPERVGSPSNVSIVSKSQSSALSISKDRSDDLSNQYAKIDEFQQYLPMAPAASATLPVNRGATFPPPPSPSRDDSDARRERSVTMTHPFPFNHHGSAPVMHTGHDRAKTLIGRWKRYLTESSIEESDESSLSNSVSSASMQSTPKRSTLIDPHRPLPPSPTKMLRGSEGLSRQISSGSNIYEVIDEDYLSKVRNKKRVLGEQYIIPEFVPEFVPPVDPQHFEKYLEIVQRFFNIPEVRDHWINSVRTVMPDADPSNFPPPFYSPPLKEPEAELQETEAESQETEAASQPTPPEPEEQPSVSRVKSAVSKFESATGRNSHSSPANKRKKQMNDRTLISKSPQLSTEKPTKQDDDRPSISKSSQSFTEQKKQDDDKIPIVLRGGPIALPSSTPTSPAAHRLQKVAAARSPRPTPPLMSRSSSSSTPHVLKKMGSRDNMIEFLNRTLNQSDSDDSDSDDSDSDTESETDQSDHGADPGKEDTSRPQLNGDILQTDLDTAVMRPSISTDSDFASDAIKSPQSNSVGEVNQLATGEPDSSTTTSTLVPRRNSSRRKGDLGEARNLSDSGISNCHSQAFDDAFSEQNFESDC